MQVHQIEHVNGNFGDALNGWLWSDLRPDVFDDDARVRFVGIGTMLDRQLPPAPLTVVFGTGTGYAAPPEDLHAERFRVYGVRGPLTARVLGLLDDAVLTDPAILLATHPAFQQHQSNGEVLFVPHWKSVRYGQWSDACALAGIGFVDPCADAHDVIRRIAGARLVIAESMHAAIVADAFRVPWVPVVLSREVSPFKWVDWAATLRVDYAPLRLGPSSPLERLRNRLLRHSAFACISGPLAAAGARQRWTLAELLQDRAATADRVADPWRWRGSVAAEALLKRLARFGAPVHAWLAPEAWGHDLERAAAQLAFAARREGQLSDDTAHRAALQHCQDALDRLANDQRRGLFGRPDLILH